MLKKSVTFGIALAMLPGLAFAQAAAPKSQVTRLQGDERSKTSISAAAAAATAERFDKVVVANAATASGAARAINLADRNNVPLVLVWPKIGFQEGALEKILRPGGEALVIGKTLGKAEKQLTNGGFKVTRVENNAEKIAAKAAKAPKEGPAGVLANIPFLEDWGTQGAPKEIISVDGTNWQEVVIGGNIAARADGALAIGADDLKAIHTKWPEVPVVKAGWKGKKAVFPEEVKVARTVENPDVRTWALTESKDKPVEKVYLATNKVFADAAVAVSIAQGDGVVVLADGKKSDDNLRNMLKPYTEGKGLTVVGGDRAISKQVAEGLAWVP